MKILLNAQQKLSDNFDSYHQANNSLPFSIWIKDERQLCKQQARQEMLLSERDRELKHGGHSLVLHHTGKC